MAEEIGLEAALGLSEWERNVDSYIRSVDRMNSRNAEFVQAAGQHYANLGGVILGAAGAAATAATAIAAVTGKAILDWTAEGVDKATDLEAQLSGIAAVMTKSREEIAPFSDLIGNLSLDPTLKVNTTEAASAIEMLARNGLDMTEILDGAARSTVLLANATDADFGTAADLATDVMSIFNIEAKDMQSAVNGITSVVNNSKFTIDDYRLAMARGGSQAEAAGVSFDDFNAIIAFSASAFSSGQVAGTGWANLLTRLVPQSDTAAEAMKQLGLMTEDGANAFFDANGEMKDMGEVIDILNRAFGGLSEEQRIATAQTIFGRDAAGALNSVLGKTSAEYLNFKGVLSQTDAEASAATRMDNLAGALEILSGIIEAIQIQVGTTFLPVLTDMARGLAEILEGRADEIVAVFGALAEWAGEAATQLIPLAQEWLPAIIDNVIALAQWATEVARSGEVWNEWLDQMSPRLSVWIERLIHVGDAIGDVNAKIGEIIAWIGEAIAPITEWVAGFVDVEDVLIAAGLAVAAFLAPMAVAAAQMAAVGLAATLAVAVIRDAWEINLGGVRDFVADVWAQIQGIVATGIEVVQTLWGGHGESLGVFATNAWETVKGIISGALGIIQGVMNTVLAAVQGDWTTVWEDIAHAGEVIWETIKTAWNAALGALTQFLTDHWPAWSAKLGEWANAAWQWIVDAASKLPEKIGEWWAALVTWYDANKEAWGSKLGEWATVAWQWIVDAAAQIPDKLTEWYSALTIWIDEKLPEWQTKLEEWGAAAVAAMQPISTWMLEEFPNSSVAAITGMDNMRTAFADLGDTLREVFGKGDGGAQNVIQGFIQFLLTAMDAGLSEAILKLTTWISNFALSLDGLAKATQGDWAGMWESMKKIQENEDEARLQIAAAHARTWEALMKISGESAVDGFVEGIELNSADGPEAVRSMIDGVNKEVTEGLDIHSPSGKFMGFAEQSVEGFRKGFIDNISYATEAATQLIDKFMKKFDVILSNLPLVAKDSMNEFVAMFQNGMEAALQLAGARTQDFMRKFDIVMEQLPRVAFDSMTQFVGAMHDGFKTVLGEAVIFVAELLNIFDQMARETATRFEATGVDAGTGFIRGIDSKIDEAQAKVMELGDLATQALATTLEAQSPSRRFHQLGEWAGQGFINGIMAKLQEARYVAAQLGDVAAEAAAQTALVVADYAASYGVNPTGNPDADMAAVKVAAYEQETGRTWQPPDISGALDYYANAAASVVSPASSYQSYATTNQVSNNFGPYYVNTPMDMAEMEFRMRRIVNEMI